MCRDPKEESRLDFSGFDCFLISISLTFLKIYPSWQPGGSRRYCHLEGYVAGMDGMGGWVCACVWSSVLSCSLLEYAVASASTSSLLSTFLVRHCFSCISSTTHSTQTNSLADGMTSLCSCTLPRNMEMKCCMIPIPIHIWHVAQKCMLWYPCWFMLPIFALKRCNAFCQATTIRGGKCQESLGLWRCLLWTFLLDRFARSSYGMHVKTWWWWWWWWWWLFRITARVWSWHPPFHLVISCDFISTSSQRKEITAKMQRDAAGTWTMDLKSSSVGPVFSLWPPPVHRPIRYELELGPSEAGNRQLAQCGLVEWHNSKKGICRGIQIFSWMLQVGDIFTSSMFIHHSRSPLANLGCMLDPFCLTVKCFGSFASIKLCLFL